MIRFDCDYNLVGHPQILARLAEIQGEQHPGYGRDVHSQRAAKLIAARCGKDVDVHFLMGGTQTNMTVIRALLRPHQGVYSAASGHIATHEAGAIEMSGHKVLVLPSRNGKLDAETVQCAYTEFCEDDANEHMVHPKLVYISQPTESGTLYSKAELEALYRVCKECGLLLYLDGARLGYGFAAAPGDMTLADIANNTDVFYIGGTKVGAMFGEAVVICNKAYQAEFRTIMKQSGAMLAKGFLIGVQFEVLFEDGLYDMISAHAVRQALRIKDAFLKKGIPLMVDSPTNQQFPVLPDTVLAEIGKKYAYCYWARIDETHSAVRFCTSWATREADVDALVRDIEAL